MDLGAEINPYLKIVESQLSLLYFDIEEYDSAYYYGKDAFLFYPDNNIHRHAYFQSLVNKRDSTELDKSFELISREVKPWPGDVDVEGMPEESESDGSVDG